MHNVNNGQLYSQQTVAQHNNKGPMLPLLGVLTTISGLDRVVETPSGI